MNRTDLPTDLSGAPIQVGFIAKTGAETLDGSSSAATQSTVYSSDTVIRMSSVAFADCYVAIGPTPTAVAEAADTILVNGTEYMVIGAGDKLSVIGGKLNVVSALK